jgi:hypothetical protein
LNLELLKLPKNNKNVDLDLYLCRVCHARLGRGGATSLFAEEKIFVKEYATVMNYKNCCFKNCKELFSIGQGKRKRERKQ